MSMSGVEPVGNIAFLAQLGEIENADLGCRARELLSDELTVGAARLVVVAQDHEARVFEVRGQLPSRHFPFFYPAPSGLQVAGRPSPTRRSASFSPSVKKMMCSAAMASRSSGKR